MTDPLVDTTIVNNLIGRMLVTGAIKVSPDIHVLYAHEEPPSAYPDSDTDTALERWCRLNPIRLEELPGRRGSGDADSQGFVMSITVGVSDAQMRASPARLNQSMHLVAAAIHGAYGGHDTTTHHVQIERVNRDTLRGGSGAASLTGSVTVSGTATRVSGSSASLSS